MTTNEQKLVLIKADEGKWLTLDYKIFTKSMYLSASLTADDVFEATDEEKQDFEAEPETNETETE